MIQMVFVATKTQWDTSNQGLVIPIMKVLELTTVTEWFATPIVWVNTPCACQTRNVMILQIPLALQSPSTED